MTESATWREDRIEYLEKECAKKDKRIASLEQQVKQLKQNMSKLGKEVSQKTESIPSLPPASAAAAATSADQPMTEEQIKNSLKARVTGEIKEERYQKHYTINKALKLGTGMNGPVYAVKDKYGASFAIKQISKSRLGAEAIAGLRMEIKLLSQLDHPNIVKLIEAFDTPSSTTMIMEICSGGELYDSLLDVETYSESVAKKVFRQMVSAVGYVHQMGIVHRDLKLENFLFESKAAGAPIKLIDFGLSKKYGIGRLKSLVGTAYYVAPEVLQRTAYGPKCDVWSLGVILFMMLSGWPPFRGANEREIMRNIKTKDIDFSTDPEVGYWDSMPAARDLMKKLFIKNWKQRPNCAQILQDPWLKQTSAVKVIPRVVSNLRATMGANKLRQATAQIVALSMPSSKIREIQASFSALDVDGSGQISMKEFKEGLVGHENMDAADVEALFNKVDIDKTGLISYSEFLSAALNNSELMTKERVLQSFDRLDADGSGTLSSSEMSKVLNGFMDAKEVQAIIDLADSDGDGVISREEFLAAVI